MSGFFMHAVVYVAVNGLLIAIWVLFGDGSAADVEESFRSPDAARELGFWPLYVIVFWGAGLLIHGGAATIHTLRRAKHHARRWARREPKPGSEGGINDEADVGVSGPATAKSDRGQAHQGETAQGETATTPAPRRWVAVMFTDIVESTELADRIGDGAFAELLAEHRQLVRSCLDEHQGAEVGTQGDGFLIRFDSPDDAATCAVTLQRSVADEVPIRIGIHAGEVVHDGTDDDLVGRVVNLAARVTDVATAREVLITEAVADQLQSDRKLTDRGLRDLKGFSQPRHLLSLVWQESPTTLNLDTAH